MMWLYNIKDIESKALSPVELLVLSHVSDKEPIPPKEIINDLNSLFTHWRADKGTIYPLLHRLESRNLLAKSRDRKLAFQRTTKGSSFLLSSNENIVAQIEAMFRYFYNISQNFTQSDPIAAQNYLLEVKQLIQQFAEDTDALIVTAQQLEKKDNWKRVEIE